MDDVRKEIARELLALGAFVDDVDTEGLSRAGQVLHELRMDIVLGRRFGGHNPSHREVRELTQDIVIPVVLVLREKMDSRALAAFPPATPRAPRAAPRGVAWLARVHGGPREKRPVRNALERKDARMAW